MPVSRRYVDRLARRAAPRPISPEARADLDDALAELREVITSGPVPPDLLDQIEQTLTSSLRGHQPR